MNKSKPVFDTELCILVLFLVPPSFLRAILRQSPSCVFLNLCRDCSAKSVALTDAISSYHSNEYGKNSYF